MVNISAIALYLKAVLFIILSIQFVILKRSENVKPFNATHSFSTTKLFANNDSQTKQLLREFDPAERFYPHSAKKKYWF